MGESGSVQGAELAFLPYFIFQIKSDQPLHKKKKGKQNSPLDRSHIANDENIGMGRELGKCL